MTSKRTVVVGMSGGVDSSLTASLLKEKGYRVIGLFMKNWEEQNDSGQCRSSLEFEDVSRVCTELGIPYYSVNFVEEYRERVFEDFLKGFKLGYTPNPDILCNREIKFDLFFQHAMKLGADFLATGHYCQIGIGNQLYKGKDPGKDQSYFLHAIDSSTLSKVLFPIGHLHKSEVRKMARERGLATSEKKDSTGICFIGKRDFKPFLGSYLSFNPGPLVTLEGEVVGEHDGAAFYTPGQRKGLGIGGAGEAWFVVDKEIEQNKVIVAQGASHPALFCDHLVATDLNWLVDPPATFPFFCTSKVRYRQPDQSCIVEKIENGKAFVRFTIPQRAVTLGQSIVFYQGELCLGGGVIVERGASYHEQKRLLPNKVAP